MSPVKAKQTVLVAMIALIAINLYRVKSDGSMYKRLWGTGVVGVFLSILADFAPSIAGPFAVLTVLGSLTNGGDKALQNLLGGASATAAVKGPTGTTVPQGSTTTTTTTTTAPPRVVGPQK